MTGVANTTAPPRASPSPDPRRRSGRRRRVSAGDLGALKREVWHGIRVVGGLLDDPNAAPADLVRAAHALANLANAYRAATEAADLLPRLEAVEATLAAGRP